MYYYGNFRSNDTTVDSNGQRYRVAIFTQYDGSNPYPYNRIEFEPTAGGYAYAPIVWPRTATTLTMATQPFVTTAEGDTTNVYKPYRCSTASVSFLQDNVNMDFFSANGTSTLVVLLKYKNEVYEDNGVMVNASTGERLYKLHVERDGLTYYDNYEPCAYDRFCYNVEWIGFATPQTFTMEYDHTNNLFTLNCQDALSSLQYTKYDGDADNSLVSFKDTLLDMLCKLSTYRTVYITDTIKTADSSAPLWQQLQMQSANWYDENKEPDNCLNVLSEMLQYSGLTAIPYCNSLIITTPNAIAEGYTNYNVYTLPSNGYIMNWSAEGAIYSQQPDVNLNHTYTITADSFSNAGTSISTTDTYNKVTVTADEYYKPLIVPDIADGENLDDPYYNMYAFQRVTADPNVYRYFTWEHEMFNSTNSQLDLLQYDGEGWDASALDTPVYTDDWYLQHRSFACVCDDGGLREETAAQCNKHKYTPTRKLLLSTSVMTIYQNISVAPTRVLSQLGINQDDKATCWQPLLHAKTDKVLCKNGDFLQILGEWTFYNSNAVYIPSTLLQHSDLADLKMDSNYSYIWAMVRVGNKYLANQPNSTAYTWSETEAKVKLNLTYDGSTNAFGTAIPYASTHRNLDGVIVELPADGVRLADVEIWIDRPLGVHNFVCTCATCNGFGAAVLSKEYVDSGGNKVLDNSNTEYTAEINADAVSAYDDIKLRLSSNSEKNTRYSQTCRQRGTVTTTTPKVYNVATATYTTPEAHITANTANQYAQPVITLTMPLHSVVKPYSRVLWGQMSNRTFIVDSIETDFEREQQTVTLSEVKAPTAQTTTTYNRTRNYRRNGDIIADSSTVKRAPELIANTAVTVGTFDASNGSIIYTPYLQRDDLTGVSSLGVDYSTGELLFSVPNDLDSILDASTIDNALTITINT